MGMDTDLLRRNILQELLDIETNYKSIVKSKLPHIKSDLLREELTRLRTVDAITMGLPELKHHSTKARELTCKITDVLYADGGIH